LLLVVALVLLGPKLLGGSSTSALAVPIPTHSVKPSASTPTLAPTPVPTTAPVVSDAAFRDPFAKLPQEIAASSVASTTSSTGAVLPTTTAGTTATSSATTGTGFPIPSPGPTTAGSGTATSGTTSAGSSGSSSGAATTSSVIAGKPVQYMSFAGGGSAKVEIDSTPYTASAGQIISGYRVVSVSSGSIQVAHGAITKTLALGELQTF
jgi:hypothetical protein